MSGRTISTGYASGVSLTNSSDNPVTITSSGSIGNANGPALQGAASTYWTINNGGLVVASGTTTGDAGLVLAGGGQITNLSTGAIGGYDFGVSVADTGSIVNDGTIHASKTVGPGYTYNSTTQSFIAFNAGVDIGGGSVTNATSAVIGGYFNGVVIGGGGSVANQGTIDGGFGVVLTAGGNVSNATTGTIYSGRFGVLGIGGVAVGIYNQGLIQSLVGYGVDLFSGGSLTNTGTIEAAIDGVLLQGTAASTVTNQGLIDGESRAGVGMFAGGTLSNAGTGMITGSIYGILTVDDAVSVTNQGGISGLSRYGIDLFAGGSLNNEGGIIYGGNYGVAAVTAAGTVTNSGEIGGGTLGGVALFDGGSVNNSGTIAGARNGVYGGGGVTSNLTNSGAIFGDELVGVYLINGGYASNSNTGTIAGSYFGIKALAVSTVVNSGNVYSVQYYSGSYPFDAAGMDLAAGGTVTNNKNARIAATWKGVEIGTRTTNVGGTVLNQGLIYANNTAGTIVTGAAVWIHGPGLISNSSYGTIAGGPFGIVAYNQTTLENAGLVGGSDFAFDADVPGYADLVVVDPKAQFVGEVFGGNSIGSSIVSTLEFAGGTATGTLSGIGSHYVDFGQITIDAGASWQLIGTGNSLAAGGTLTNHGTLTLNAATFSDAGVLENDGSLVLDPSVLHVAALTGNGTAALQAGSTLDAQGTVGSGETIAFSGTGALLQLDTPGNAHGSVTSFAQGDTIDLAGVNPSSVSYSSGAVHFTASGTAASFPLLLAPGNVLATPAGDGSGGTELTAMLCFCAGTGIATPNGEMPVERLAVGDLVLTRDGMARPIVWIGVGCVMVTRGRRSAATPVIVRRGALADNVPHRDLRVTKGHALWIDDVLVPVEFLVNHRSIIWDDRAQEVTIYHVELATHDVLIADGAPAESYRDDGNRWLFRNARSGAELPLQPACAPVLTGGPVVDAIWQRLLDRAGPRGALPLTDDADLHVRFDGQRMDAAERVGNVYVFRLPRVPTELRLASRASVAAELGLSRDARPLGVAVQRIVLRRGTRFRTTRADDPRLTAGFHAFERGNGWRWTNGDAQVPQALFAGFAGSLELVLHVGATTRYLADGDERQAA